MANPKQLKWILKTKKKNDRVDSEKLARLLMVGMLTEAHLLSRERTAEQGPSRPASQLGHEIGRMKKDSELPEQLEREPCGHHEHECNDEEHYHRGGANASAFEHFRELWRWRAGLSTRQHLFS